jgi:hypothetical protein
MTDLINTTVRTFLDHKWRKGIRSYENGACVEVRVLNGVVQLRDSKDPDGPMLGFTPGQWTAFVGAVVTGQFEHPNQ